MSSPPAVYLQHWSYTAGLILIFSSDPCLDQVLESAKVEMIDQRVHAVIEVYFQKGAYAYYTPGETTSIGRLFGVMKVCHVLNFMNSESYI